MTRATPALLAHPSWCDWSHSAEFDHTSRLDLFRTSDASDIVAGLLLVRDARPHSAGQPHVRIAVDLDDVGENHMLDLAPVQAAALARVLLSLYGEHPFARALFDLAQLDEEVRTR